MRKFIALNAAAALLLLASQFALAAPQYDSDDDDYDDWGFGSRGEVSFGNNVKTGETRHTVQIGVAHIDQQ